jgi:ADP-ribose pyrophosphatase
VAVLPVEANQVWLVSQFRTAVGEPVLEIPAGKVERGETRVADAARRELDEELGATAEELIHLTTMFPSPGYTDESIAIYAASGLRFGPRRPQGAEEINSMIATLSMEEALHRIESGDIKDSKTQIALLLWARRRS